MFFGAHGDLFEKARKLRTKPTPAEAQLWEVLKENKLLGLRFKRQHPIKGFIADFYCHKAHLVIEVDGGIHQRQCEYDRERTQVMIEFGLRVIRFKNEDVSEKLNWVIDEIKKELKSAT